MSAMRLEDRHQRPLELAALALDFDLTAAETGELEAHLAGCPTCARRVAALRADARSLSRPLALLPSARVDDAVYAAIARRRSGPQRVWLLAAAALLLLAMLGAVVVGAYLLQAWQNVPTTEVTPTQPVAIASPDPDASPPLVGEAWESIPFDDVSGGHMEAVTFDGLNLIGVGSGGGCVVDSDGTGGCTAPAWRASAGEAWVRAPAQGGLTVGPGQPESGPQSGMTDVASGPNGLIAVGYDNDPLPGSCPVAPCTSGPAVWRSLDGRNWGRVQVDFGPAVIDTFAEPIAAITAGPDGYVMVGRALALSPTGDSEGHATAWASPDGVTWTRATDSEDLTLGGCVESDPIQDCGGMTAVAATPFGFVAVGYRWEGGTTQSPTAWTSPDGLTWTLTMAGLDFEGRLDSVVVGPVGVVAGGTLCAPQDCHGTSAVLGADGNWTVPPANGQAMGDLERLATVGDAMFGLTRTADLLELWRSEDGRAWQRVEGLPSIADVQNYRGVDLAGTPDRLVVAGWAAVGADTSRNFSYASPPRSASTLGQALPAKVGQFGDVVSFDSPRLVSESAGWQPTGFGFYRTDDMGKSWTQVRPPGWSATAAGLTAMVDAETMYAALPGPPPTIAATHDGGVSWTQATINDASVTGGPLLSFRTVDRGTATFFAGDDKELRVYDTADGGVTWAGPVVVPAPSGIMGGKIEGPRSGVLWIRNGKADNEPFDNQFLLSTDGGVTWRERSLPFGAAAPKDDLKWPEGMWADGNGQIVMAISLGEGEQIYKSDDDGRSWQFVRGVPKSGGVHLLSATEWILMAYDGSEVWSTLDGGTNWRKVVGTSRIYLQYSSFASPDHGWAIHECPRDGRTPVPGPDRFCDGTGLMQVFLTTIDGGRTWTQLGE